MQLSSKNANAIADTLQDADKGGVDGDQSAGVWCLDMAFAVFRAEPLEQSDLFIGQAELAFSGGPLQPLQPIVLVNRLWRCHPPRTPPKETWMPRSISSWATRIGPWQGWARA